METLSKEKQIKEMVQDICRLGNPCKKCSAYPDACKAMKYAERFYNEGYRKQEWISVDERLPEDGGTYLVYNPSRMVLKVVTARYSKGSNRWCSADACCYHEGITHWMPIPEPPKMKG